jgi:hypothetical protein
MIYHFVDDIEVVNVVLKVNVDVEGNITVADTYKNYQEEVIRAVNFKLLLRDNLYNQLFIW